MYTQREIWDWLTTPDLPQVAVLLLLLAVLLWKTQAGRTVIDAAHPVSRGVFGIIREFFLPLAVVVVIVLLLLF